MVIGGIGVGLFVLAVVWILALTIFVIGIKFQNNVAWISLISATIVTVTLLLIPLENSSKSSEESDKSDEDYRFIYKILLLSFLILSALLGLVCFFILHCIDPIRSKGIKYFYTFNKR